MEILILTLFIAAFVLLLIPASLLPVLAGAALGADTVDHLEIVDLSEVGVESAWPGEERLAA